jgi:hypothetical protein
VHPFWAVLESLSAYSTALTYFVESCPKVFMDEIDSKDLLRFAGFLRDTFG